ncbi:LysR family transcriptional regulator [Burkholderiaceae bacterium 16]|nr:LysR family transcriptional regulator [Burkholderiaceae bacterium 16]
MPENFSSDPKPRRLPPLSALRAFEATARHLSVKRAAQELSVTPTAVSHQLRLLEQVLGVMLFERLPRRLVLSAHGAALYPGTRDGFDALEQAVARLRAPPPRKTLTVSATPAFAARWLLPRAPGLRTVAPGFDLHVHASLDPVDLHAGQADAAIRYGGGKWRGLAAELLWRERFAPVCSPALGVKSAAGLRRQTLLHHAWRSNARRPVTWALWQQEAALDRLDVASGPTFSEETHAILAAVAGQGVALLSLALVAEELCSGALVQPCGPVIEGDGYYLVYPAHRRDDEAVRAIRAWIGPAANPAAP